MNYKNKYNKYKNKYIQLKNIIGGAQTSIISVPFTKYICNYNVGFNNRFGTCWFISILLIFLFSDITSQDVQENLHLKNYNFTLLNECFTKLNTDTKIKSTIIELLNNIKLRLDNKMAQCTLLSNEHNEVDVEKPVRQLLKQTSIICELELGTNLYNILNMKIDKENPIFGASIIAIYTITNILSCVLLNNFTMFTRYIFYMSAANKTLINSKPIIIQEDTFGIILSSIYHICSFSTCNNNKVFTDNNEIYLYDWIILINKYNDLIIKNIKCHIVYGQITNDVPAILIESDNDIANVLYYYDYIHERFMTKQYNDTSQLTFIHQIIILKLESDINNLQTKNFSYLYTYSLRLDDSFRRDTLKQYYISKLSHINIFADKKLLIDIRDYNTSIELSINGFIFNPIFEDISIDDTNIILQLLEYNKHNNVNMQNIDGNTMLHIACMSNNTNIVEKLLKFTNINVNLQNNDGNTMLHIACMSNNTNIVEKLLKFTDINVNLRNNAGNTPLNIARYNKYNTLINLFFNHNTPLKITTTPLIDESGNTPLNITTTHPIDKSNNTPLDITTLIIDESGNTELHLACLSENIDLVKELLPIKTKSVNLKNNDGNTPLYIACRSNNIEIVKKLLAIKTISVNLKNNDGNTPLHIACLNNNKKIVEELIKNSNISTSVNQKNNIGDTPLHIVCLNNNIEIVKQLLTIRLINVFLENSIGNTSVHIACLNNNIEIVKQLLNFSNILVNLQNTNEGNTPLHIACSTENIVLVNQLLKIKNIYVNLLNNNKNSALHIACRRSNIEIVNQLLAIRAISVNTQNKYGNTPLHMACMNNNIEIVKQLLQLSNILVNLQNTYGNTPLHIACIIESIEIVQQLLQISNIVVNLQNENNDTALHIACTQTCSDIITLLLNTTIDINIKNTQQKSALTIFCANKHFINLYNIRPANCNIQFNEMKNK